MHLLGVAPVERDGHHRAAHIDAVIELPPALSAVLAAIDPPRLAARGVGDAGIHDGGILRRNDDVAAIAQMRGVLADFQVVPVRASIGAAEQSHAQREEHGARRGGRHAQRVHVQHALGLVLGEDGAFERGLARQAHKFVAAIVPALAAVVAAHRAVHFHRGVDLVGPCGGYVQAHDAGGEGADHALGDRRARHLAPGVAAIVAAIQAERCSAGHDRAMIPRMDHHRPHLLTRRRGHDTVPAVAVVQAAIQAAAGGGVHDSRFIGMHGDGVRMGVRAEAVGQMFPMAIVDRAAEHAAGVTASAARRAGIDVGWHWLFLRARRA